MEEFGFRRNKKSMNTAKGAKGREYERPLKGFPGIYLILVVALVTGVFFGCASIINGDQQNIDFVTEPEGAKITIYDSNNMVVWSSKTPVTVSLKRGNGYFQGATYRVIIEKPGYARKQFQIKNTLNAGWYLAGNLFLGGWIGWLIVDPITGAMWNLTPEKVSVVLENAGSSLLLPGKQGKVESYAHKAHDANDPHDTHDARTLKNRLVIILRSQIDDKLFNELKPVRLN